MWPGTKACLKARANMIKACPYQLVRPEETGRQTQAGNQTHPAPPATPPKIMGIETIYNIAPSTKQALRLPGWGFYLRLKSETTLFPGLGWVEPAVCAFSPASAGLLFDVLSSENITFVDGGRPLFLRGFVISSHLAKYSQAPFSVKHLSCRKVSWVFDWCVQVCAHTHFVSCLIHMKDLIPDCFIQLEFTLV